MSTPVGALGRSTAVTNRAEVNDWNGRTVLVTGSTRGIGLGTARAFAARGAAVVIHGRDIAAGGVVVAELVRGGARAAFVAADLVEPEAPARLVDFAVTEFGGLDVLVNNAGANTFNGLFGTTVQAWELGLNLDLRAAWLATVAAALVMPAGSAIINVSSNHAFATMPGIFPYNVAKAGLLALTQSAALELSDRGIRVNAVCPGYVDTPINDAYFGTFADPDAERRRVAGLHPLGRIGRVEEVAEAILFLASPRCAFMTGTSLIVDGGRSAMMQDPS